VNPDSQWLRREFKNPGKEVQGNCPGCGVWIGKEDAGEEGSHA
jgi:hypothetical protein